MLAVSLFIDSNVLLYTRDAFWTDKGRAAAKWLSVAVELNVACTNLQVLNEVTHVMLRKRRDLTPDEIFASVDELSFLGRSPIDDHVTSLARAVRKGTNYSWWDCLLLTSALELGCTHFLSEDLHDGHTIEGLTIVDPFAHTPDQILASP
jgi:predicted nucleic acid-binding protein